MAGIYWRKVQDKLSMDGNAKEHVEDDVIKTSGDDELASKSSPDGSGEYIRTCIHSLKRRLDGSFLAAPHEIFLNEIHKDS